MNSCYTKLQNGFCCFATALLLAACSSNLTYNEAMQKNVRTIEDSEKLDDARFLIDAASYNILATKMAEAAIESGYSASVVSLAKENLEAHQEMGKELRKLARKEDVALPGQMNSEHARVLSQLTGSDRRTFDKTYLQLLREVSEQDSQKFANMATDASSDDVRAFAARKLDLFESHRQEIETVDAELLRTY